MMRTSAGGGRMGGPITQPRSLRTVQVQDSPSTKLVPGPISAHIHETTGQRRRVHGMMTEGRPPVPKPAEFHGTPKGFWDQQVSSRGIGKDSTEVDGRENPVTLQLEQHHHVRVGERFVAAIVADASGQLLDDHAQLLGVVSHSVVSGTHHDR